MNLQGGTPAGTPTEGAAGAAPSGRGTKRKKGAKDDEEDDDDEEPEAKPVPKKPGRKGKAPKPPPAAAAATPPPEDLFMGDPDGDAGAIVDVLRESVKWDSDCQAALWRILTAEALGRGVVSAEAVAAAVLSAAADADGGYAGGDDGPSVLGPAEARLGLGALLAAVPPSRRLVAALLELPAEPPLEEMAGTVLNTWRALCQSKNAPAGGTAEARPGSGDGDRKERRGARTCGSKGAREGSEEGVEGSEERDQKGGQGGGNESGVDDALAMVRSVLDARDESLSEGGDKKVRTPAGKRKAEAARKTIGLAWGAAL